MANSCPHGGRFYSVLGKRLEKLQWLSDIVPADVLDAWFPPAPSVLEVLQETLPLAARTSPPTHAEPLELALGDYFGVDKEAVLAGPGSSSLIFLALTQWLHSGAKVFLPDPSYSEYRHVANLMGAQISSKPLWPGLTFSLPKEECDLAVIINPNNPTGWHVRSSDLGAALTERSPTTKIWIDEAYAAYVPEIGSLATLAATQPGVFISRTLSKSHALSGLRVACLIGHPDEIAKLRRLMPPWALSLPAQVAAIQALQEDGYYRGRYVETAAIRADLASFLRKNGFDLLASEANWVLARHPHAEYLLEECERQGVYLRDPSNMCVESWPETLRIAVRSPQETQRIKASLLQCELPSSRLITQI